MTHSEFIKKYANTKQTDYDGSGGKAQCVDLVKRYLKEVYGIGAHSIGYARYYIEKFDSHPEFNKKFYVVLNTAEFIPLQYDICIFGSKVGGGCGHCAIGTTSKSNTVKKFYTYDYNWSKDAKTMEYVCHAYKKDDFLGVLRPYYKNTVALNCRKLPKVNAELVKTYPAGTKLKVYGHSSDLKWYKTDDGWVSANYMEVIR